MQTSAGFQVGCGCRQRSRSRPTALLCLSTGFCVDKRDANLVTCFLCPCRWLCLAGAETYTAVATLFRAALKDSIVPLLCSLATEDTTSGPHILLEPYEQLVNIGEVPADTELFTIKEAFLLQAMT